MRPIAILHEGSADVDLLKQLIRHLELDLEQCEFYAMGSKANFFKADYKDYITLKDRFAADQVRKIFFMLDADDVKHDAVYGGYENTERSLQTIIQQLDLLAVSSYFIICDPQTKTGYLESLLLASISEPQRQCITAFLSCSNFKSKDNHKAILNSIYKLAYPAEPYDFAHSNFAGLKRELAQLFSTALV